MFRGNLSEAITHFSDKRPKGEFTFVIEGAEEFVPDAETSATNLEGALKARRDAGLSARDAVPLIAKELGLPKKVVYAAWLELADH